MGGIGKQNRTPVGEKTPQKASIRDESIFTTIDTLLNPTMLSAGRLVVDVGHACG